jgi:hypothetical protein
MQIPWSDKFLLIEAIFLSVVVKIMVMILPLRWYSKILGEQNKDTIGEVSDLSRHKIYKISVAIVRSRKVFPWENRCLIEAITGKILLRHYGLNSTLYLGVRKEDKLLAAHAWLRCGDIFVTGRRGMNKFNVVSTFS